MLRTKRNPYKRRADWGEQQLAAATTIEQRVKVYRVVNTAHSVIYEKLVQLFEDCSIEFALAYKDEGITDCDICANYLRCNALWDEFVVLARTDEDYEEIKTRLSLLRSCKYLTQNVV